MREIFQFLISLQKRNQQCVGHKTLMEKDVTKIEKVTKAIAKVLDGSEKLSVREQNILPEEKLQRKLTTICFTFKVC